MLIMIKKKIKSIKIRLFIVERLVNISVNL
nr:MAG TPA: hypothetical protein [Caudoviricetes sp.]